MSVRPVLNCCSPFLAPKGEYRHQKSCPESPLAIALVEVRSPDRAAIASHVERARRQSGMCSLHPSEPEDTCAACVEAGERAWERRAI